MGIFSKKEAKYYIITIVILTIIFGFNDKASSFDLNHWLNNLLLVLIAVIVSFLVAHSVHKIIASRFYCRSEYNLWGLRRFGFAPHLKTKLMKKEFTFPAGILFPLLITMMSNGLWYFATVGTYNLIEEKTKRVGKIFTKLTGYDRTIIYLSGPLTNLTLFFIFLFLNNSIGGFDAFITVNMWLALFGLLPLPNLIGAEMLFGSLPMYLFAIVFFVISAIIAPLSLLLAIPLALILALTLFVVYHINISK